MITDVLQWIIYKEFEKNIGRNQVPIFSAKTSPEFWAMDLSFSLYPFVEKQESGYRHMHMRIYGPMNYVAVLVREAWNVINEGDIDYDKDCLKPGKDYLKGSTGWMLASYHDSCWLTDGVHQILHAYGNRISSIYSFDHWYKKVSLTEEDRKAIQTLISERDHGNFINHWDSEKVLGVLV
jgi:hypothetical protein